MGDGYEVLVSREVHDLLDDLDERSRRIVRENLAKLSEPYPGEGQGDKERVTWRGREVYRLHIGRTWTAFYDVEENDDVVKVLSVMPIDDVHKEYGSLDRDSAKFEGPGQSKRSRANEVEIVERSTLCGP